jgi:hypothetical protein
MFRRTTAVLAGAAVILALACAINPQPLPPAAFDTAPADGGAVTDGGVFGSSSDGVSPTPLGVDAAPDAGTASGSSGDAGQDANGAVDGAADGAADAGADAEDSSAADGSADADAGD